MSCYCPNITPIANSLTNPAAAFALYFGFFVYVT